MAKLTLLDRSTLFNLLVEQKILQERRGRATILRNAGLDFLIPQVDLEGSTMVVMSELIQILENYGHVSYDNDALGTFLSALKSFVGIETQELIDHLLLKYGLLIPIVRHPVINDWKSKETREEIVEAIIGENTLIPIGFFQKGLEVSKAVALVLIKAQGKNWAGSGFLIGSKYLRTNHHVIPSADLCKSAIFRFNYELDSTGNPKIFQDYKWNERGFFTDQQLDFTLLELEDTPGSEWGVLELSHSPINNENRVNIIQHPGGMPKHVSFRNNFIKYVNTNILQYVTTTMPGSSGSPIFGDDWKVIGVHHAGGYLAEPNTGMYYFRNEGILISAIMKIAPMELKKLISGI